MRIGLDFDNTIVCYDALFHTVAVEQKLIPSDTPISKLAVRDHLRRLGQNQTWTQLQGYVYGARMSEAVAYPGAIEFIREARRFGNEIIIVSHKTRHPFLGPRYDLHDAAAKWIEAELTDGASSLVAVDHVFFELTKEEKIARIGACACDYFVDDLPEILQMQGFATGITKLLFDPQDLHRTVNIRRRFVSWQALLFYFDSKWVTQV
jgi:hypothetical protein